MTTTPRPSPLGLAVLGLLCGGPLHPYAMQRLLREWGKDQVINVGQRSSLYKTIKRLRENDLIAVAQTERNQQYPERTIYELTDQGRATALSWLTDMVATPRNEFPQFPAALSFLMLLDPNDARSALQARAEALRTDLSSIQRELDHHALGLPRVTLLETEYQRAVLAAESAWVDGLIHELGSGTLSWSEEDFSSAADAYQLTDSLPDR